MKPMVVMKIKSGHVVGQGNNATDLEEKKGKNLTTDRPELKRKITEEKNMNVPK